MWSPFKLSSANAKSKENDDEEWEYYDDSTTLSDFWSSLIETGAENPLSLWLQAFEEASKSGFKGLAEYTELSTPDNVFKEYWRILVPRYLALSHKSNSLTHKWDEEKIRQSLLDPLDAFICGSDDFQTIYQILSENDSPPVLCGKVFQAGEPTYGCKDCGQDATCVLCHECFSHSEHKHHRYRMSTTDGGGFCDCGDSEAFLKDSMCAKHQELTRNNVSMDEILATFPPGMADRTRLLLLQVVKYILEVTALKKKFTEFRIGGKDKETWPILKFPFEFSRFSTILINDSSHSYQEVIEVLKSSLRAPQRLAADLTEYIDKEGRAVLKVGNYPECAGLREKIERSSRHLGKPLNSEVIPTYVLAHQLFAQRLFQWMLDLFKRSSGFRKIFAQVLFATEAESKVKYGDRDFMLSEAILVLDARSWKDVRKSWFAILVEGILKDYESKKRLAQTYVSHYKEILGDFIFDDQESEASITNLSVQIFTVPSIAENLMEDFDAFSVMAEVFLDQLEEQQIAGDGKIVFEEWIENDRSEYTRALQCLQDLEYVLGVPPVGLLTKKLTAAILKGVEKYLIPILQCFQGADEHKREIYQHIEEESLEWEHVFRFSSEVFHVVEKLIGWCKRSKDLSLSIVSFLAEKILDDCELSKKKVDFESFDGTLSFEINDFDVLNNSVSVHNPLHQFMAAVFDSFSDEQILDWKTSRELPSVVQSIPRRIAEFGPILDVSDKIITTQAMLATTRIGLWRRNGSPVEGQQYVYHYPVTGLFAKRNDLTMLQFAACHDGAEGDAFLLTLLDRFGLNDWAEDSLQTSVRDEEKLEKIHLLADEFLTLLLAIILERNNPTISHTTQEQELEHRVIQYICIGSMSHSKLMKTLNADEKIEASVDEILKNVATLTSNPREPSKKIYKIKKEFGSRYNPFYYFFTNTQRDEAMSNMMSPIKQTPQGQALQDEALPLVVAGDPTNLNEMFRNLPHLASSEVTLKIIQNTLNRFSKSNPNDRRTATVQKELHKILFLITAALKDDISRRDFHATFTNRAEKIDLFEVLRALDCPGELKLLWQYTVEKFAESRSSLLNKDSDVEMATTATASVQDSDEAKARKRRALESRAKILAEMSKRQSKFSHVHEKELNEIATEEKRQLMLRRKEEEKRKNDSKSVAAGPSRSLPAFMDRGYDCVVCKQHEVVSAMDTNSNVLVILAFSMKSAALCRGLLTENFKSISPDFLPADLRCAPFVSTCGHVMHSKCYQSFHDNIALGERLRHSFRLSSEQEFFCPGCQRLCNIVVPVLPPLQSLLSRRDCSKMSFENWIQRIIEILNRKVIVDSKSESSGELDFTRMQLKNEVEVNMPNIPRSVVDMIISFAVVNFSKSFSKNPNETDSRVLQVAFESAAFALHLSQAATNSQELPTGLLRNYSPFFDECLRSLIKICFLLPFCSTKSSEGASSSKPLLRCSTSNALYLLSLALINDQDKNFLEIDVVNALVSLMATHQTLGVSESGQFDLHILQLVTVVHLIQVIAGFDGDKVSSAGDRIWISADNEEDDTAVRNLSVQISHIVGFCDVHFSKEKSPAAVVKDAMLHFLRCAALFFNVCTDVPLPTCGASSSTVEIFESLMAYLGLPVTLTGLLKVPGTSDLIDRLLCHQRLAISSAIPRYPCYRRTLIDLPEEYTHLLKKAAEARCPNNVRGECKNPALCLICGAIVCSQSTCCNVKLESGVVIGGVNAHAAKCTADTGVFLFIRECKVILILDHHRGKMVSAPYVDSYGETDDGLQRGNPLHLDRAMFENLKQIWINNEIPTKVSSFQDREFLIFGNQWGIL